MKRMDNGEIDLSSLNHYFVDVDDMKLSVYSTKQTGKSVLYCLHGGPGFDSLSLIPGLLPLSKLFDLRFVDLRGSGRSDSPRNGDYSLDATAKDVLQLIKGENPGRTIGIFGHSYGGLVALTVLAQGGDSLGFGILCGTPFDGAFGSDFSEAIERSTKPEIMDGQNRFKTQTATDLDYRDLTVSLRSLYFPELPSEQSTGILATWSYRVDAYRYAEERIFPSLDLTESALRVTAPVLMVGGKIDPIITPANVNRCANLFKNGSVQLISDAGHFPFISETDQFFLKVSQWWEVNKQSKKE
jgi:proline iminopeptidase